MRLTGGNLSYWQLVVDCPFNGNKTNYASDIIVGGTSGNFIDDPVLGSANQVARFESYNRYFQLNYADFPNTERESSILELDFLLMASSWTYTNYVNIIDASKAGTPNSWVYSQVEAGNLRFSLNPGYTSAEIVQQPISNFPSNTWFHLLMRRYNGENHIEVVNVATGNVIMSGTTPIRALYTTTFPLIIGRAYYYTSRWFNGCIKNFKLYKHL